MFNESDAKKALGPLLRPTEKFLKVYAGFHIINEQHEEEAFFALIYANNSILSPVALFLIWKNSEAPVISRIIKINSTLTISPKVDALNQGVELAVIRDQARQYIVLKNLKKEANLSFESQNDLQDFRNVIYNILQLSKQYYFIFFERMSFSWLSFYIEHGDSEKDVGNNHLGKKLPGNNAIGTKNWIKQRILMREHEYIDLKDLKLAVFTWNVNGVDPPLPKTTHSHIPPNEKPGGSETDAGCCFSCRIKDSSPDLVVFGFQELDLSASSFVYMDSLKEPMWADFVEAVFKDSCIKYTRVTTKRLVGIYTLVYCKEQLSEKIKSKIDTSIGVGVLGSMGNKGAVAIRLKFDETVFTFVNSHLSHDDSMLDKRNFQFHEISKKLEFEEILISTVNSKSIVDSNKFSIFDSHLVVWFGDLNYRIDLENDKTRELIESKDFNTLLGYDQLSSSMRYGFAFKEFEEAEIGFSPTYKYVNGTSEYNRVRNPAWTDRILWLANRSLPYEYESSYIENLGYNTSPNYFISDHKPVWGLFNIKSKEINKEKYDVSMSMVLKELDLLENNMSPTVKLNTNELKFGTVSYCTKYTKAVTMHNPGIVPVGFNVFPCSASKGSSCSWLWASGFQGTVQPGKDVVLQFVVYIDRDSIFRILKDNPDNQFAYQDKHTLSEIFIVRLEGGKEIFLDISAEYCFSYIGLGIPQLKQTSIHFGDFKLKPEINDALSNIEKPSVPQILFILFSLLDGFKSTVDSWFVVEKSNRITKNVMRYLEDQRLATADINEPRSTKKIRDKFVKSVGVNFENNNQVANSILFIIFVILNSFPSSLIPSKLYMMAVTTGVINSATETKKALSQFPNDNRVLLVYISSKLLSYADFGTDPAEIKKRFAFISSIVFTRAIGNQKVSATRSITLAEKQQLEYISQFVRVLGTN